MDQATLESVLQDNLSPTYLQVVDDSARHAGHAGSGGGSHFLVTVVSEAFSGKNPVERHRMIYGLLGTQMQGAIHALALTTRTPSEWAARQA